MSDMGTILGLTPAGTRIPTKRTPPGSKRGRYRLDNKHSGTTRRRLVTYPALTLYIIPVEAAGRECRATCTDQREIGEARTGPGAAGRPRAEHRTARRRGWALTRQATPLPPRTDRPDGRRAGHKGRKAGRNPSRCAGIRRG